MMNVLKISKEYAPGTDSGKQYSGYLMLAILVMVLLFAQRVIGHADPTIGFIDPNIWLLMLMALISFMVVIGLCWWLLQRFWMSIGLPGVGSMVLQFNELAIWQQLGFYWLSFVSLLWAAIGVLGAIL